MNLQKKPPPKTRKLPTTLYTCPQSLYTDRRQQYADKPMAKLTNAKIIEEMLRELNRTEEKLQELQEYINDTGLSLDIDRAFDSLFEASEQVRRCLEVA